MIQVTKKNGASFEHMLRLVEPLYGGSAFVKPQRVNSLPIEFRALAERLVNVVCPVKEANRYLFGTLYLVFSLAELGNVSLDDSYSEYRLMKLCDFCEGLPADNQIVDFFARAYEQHTSPRLKIACAECVGYLKSGIGQAMAMFLPLLTSNDENTTRKTAEAISRTLGVQSRLAKASREWGEMFLLEHRQTVEQVVAFREALSRLASHDNLRKVLTETGCVSSLDLLINAQDQEEQFFMLNKEKLLRQYRNRFVAIHAQQIVADAVNPRILESKVRESLGAETRVLMVKVTPEAFERIPSAHIFIG